MYDSEAARVQETQLSEELGAILDRSPLISVVSDGRSGPRDMDLAFLHKAVCFSSWSQLSMRAADHSIHAYERLAFLPCRASKQYIAQWTTSLYRSLTVLTDRSNESLMCCHWHNLWGPCLRAAFNQPTNSEATIAECGLCGFRSASWVWSKSKMRRIRCS